MQRYGAAVYTRLVGLLMALMNWGLGDAQGRIELFERELIRYHRPPPHKQVSLNQGVGLVLTGLDKMALKDHFLLNSSRYAS